MDIDYKKIKLVIWDLDETFWNGTISEGEVFVIPDNIKLVENLAKRGIVNSICSKNYEDVVKEEFKKDKYNNCFDYFVFNSIDWTPKGPRIAQMISDMQLRDENVLFLDDNLSNLNEVKYFCKNIQTATPDKIADLINNINDIGKDDHELSRLKQYKILEQKFISKKSASSNDEFLKSSNIIAVINKNCLEEEERLYELCIRTNQMNFTKNRASKEELHSTLTNKNYDCAYIQVNDNFGDYGIVGFYALNKSSNQLEHFVFSCRIIGMGVAQSIFKYLNCPKINITGDVTEDLNLENKKLWVKILTDKINKSNKKQNSSKKKLNILMKGPCDLMNTFSYIQGANIDTEFIHTNKNEVSTFGQESLMQIVQTHKFTEKEKEEILKITPFMNKEDFTTNIYSDKYDAVILSIIMESNMALYKHKPDVKCVRGGEFIIPFGLIDYPLTDNTKNKNYLRKTFIWNSGYTPKQDELEKIGKEFTFIGLPTAQEVLDNLLYLRKHMNPETKLIVILGSEIQCQDNKIPGYNQCAEKNKEYNKLLLEQMSNIPNIAFVNLTDLITSQNDFTNCINHFQRYVYYKLALELVKCFPQNTIKTNFTKSNLIYRYITTNLKILASSIKRRFFKKRFRHYSRKIIQQKKEITSIKKIFNKVN